MSPLHLYTDGGVIDKNPSPIGGTWAWVLVDKDNETVIDSKSGAFQPGVFRMYPNGPRYETVSNNVTEMVAMLKGLRAVPLNTPFIVYCDSMITLGRIFRKWRWRGMPPLIEKVWFASITEKMNLDKIKNIQLAGHPTEAQLASGVGRHGYVVSKWNVLCDLRCREAGELMPRLPENRIWFEVGHSAIFLPPPAQERIAP